MALSAKDAYTTLLAGLTAVVLLAVTQAWNWPLLWNYRWGVAVLAVLGMAAGCGSAAQTWSGRDPFIIAGSVLGATALVLVIGGLITGGAAWFVALAADLLTLWALSTLHHLAHGTDRRRLPAPVA